MTTTTTNSKEVYHALPVHDGVEVSVEKKAKRSLFLPLLSFSVIAVLFVMMAHPCEHEHQRDSASIQAGRAGNMRGYSNMPMPQMIRQHEDAGDEKMAPSPHHHHSDKEEHYHHHHHGHSEDHHGGNRPMPPPGPPGPDRPHHHSGDWHHHDEKKGHSHHHGHSGDWHPHDRPMPPPGPNGGPVPLPPMPMPMESSSDSNDAPSWKSWIKVDKWFSEGSADSNDNSGDSPDSQEDSASEDAPSWKSWIKVDKLFSWGSSDSNDNSGDSSDSPENSATGAEAQEEYYGEAPEIIVEGEGFVMNNPAAYDEGVNMLVDQAVEPVQMERMPEQP